MFFFVLFFNYYYYSKPINFLKTQCILCLFRCSGMVVSKEHESFILDGRGMKSQEETPKQYAAPDDSLLSDEFAAINIIKVTI